MYRIRKGESAIKPRIKPIYPVYRVSPTTLRVGAEASVTAEMDDPDQTIERFLRLLDGSRTPEQLAVEMSLPLKDVLDGLAQLDQHNFLEDADAMVPSDLTAGELDRYAANISFFSHFCNLAGNKFAVQGILKQAHVLLLGVGGGGSHILSHLAGAGIGTVTVVDHDRVELGNLNRQLLYTTEDVGKPKVFAAAERVRALNPDVEIRPIAQRICSAADVLALLKDDVRLVICAADEPAFGIDRWVNTACVQRNRPAIFAFAQVTKGRLLTVIPFYSGCLDCLSINQVTLDPSWEHTQRNIIEQSWDFPTSMLVSHGAMLAGMVSSEAIRLLTGYAEPVALGRLYDMNFINLTATTAVTWERAERCPTCGNGRLEDIPFLSYVSERWG